MYMKIVAAGTPACTVELHSAVCQVDDTAHNTAH